MNVCVFSLVIFRRWCRLVWLVLTIELEVRIATTSQPSDPLETANVPVNISKQFILSAVSSSSQIRLFHEKYTWYILVSLRSNKKHGARVRS